MSQRLAQKSTIVTGAGAGIGRAIAKVFAAEGWGAGFMRSAAIAFARHNVTINAVLPGNIMTGSLDAIGEDYLRRVEQAIPLVDSANRMILPTRCYSLLPTRQNILLDRHWSWTADRLCLNRFQPCDC